MVIQVRLKSMGRRRQSVEAVPYEIDGHPSKVRELICAVTKAGVEAYNRRLESAELLTCLTGTQIEDQAQAGKVSFGCSYEKKAAEVSKAQENALQCFADGIYRIFLDGEPLEQLEQAITIKEDSEFTFVRLTMLAGRMW